MYNFEYRFLKYRKTLRSSTNLGSKNLLILTMDFKITVIKNSWQFFLTLSMCPIVDIERLREIILFSHVSLMSAYCFPISIKEKQ